MLRCFIASSIENKFSPAELGDNFFFLLIHAPRGIVFNIRAALSVLCIYEAIYYLYENKYESL